MNGVDLMIRSLGAPARKINDLLDELESFKGQDPVGGTDDAEMIRQMCEDWLEHNEVDRVTVLAALVALIHNSYVGMADIEDWINALTHREPSDN